MSDDEIVRIDVTPEEKEFMKSVEALRHLVSVGAMSASDAHIIRIRENRRLELSGIIRRVDNI